MQLFIHSSHHHLRMSSFSLKQNNIWSVDLTCWRSMLPLRLWFFKMLWIFWKDFWSKGDSSHLETSPPFQICTSILDFKWCLLNKWKIHSATVHHVTYMYWEGKGHKFSSQAQKCYNHCLVQLIWHYMRNCSTNQIAGNSLFSLEIIN